MIDFDKILASALSEGMSPEDIAAELTKSLNKAQNKKQEENEKKPLTRESLIDGMSNLFDEHVKNECLKLSDAIVLIWLHMIKNIDETSSIRDLLDFLDFITNEVGTLVEKWQVHKSLLLAFGIKNKSKEKESGPDREIQSDIAIVGDFLRGLGL